MFYIILGIGCIFLILEMFTPVLFFLNLAIAAFICAILALFTSNLSALVVTFCVLSIVLIFTLRPLMVKKNNDKKNETGMNSKYIGNIATAIETIDKNSGAISIYDERWQARTQNGEIIEKDSKVEIVSHESIVMYVKKAE